MQVITTKGEHKTIRPGQPVRGFRIRSITLTNEDVIGSSNMSTERLHEWLYFQVFTRFTNAKVINMINDKELEQEIVDKSLTAPRITPDNIDANIVGEDYYVFPGTTNTICLLTLRNGYKVVGNSACASVENFDEEIGRDIARANAREQLWPLMGYELRQRLHEKGE